MQAWKAMASTSQPVLTPIQYLHFSSLKVAVQNDYS